MLTSQRDKLQATAATDDDDYFEPIVLHYIKREMVAESAVLGTEMIALCGERWSADETDYAATAGDQGDRKSVICPLCGDHALLNSSLESR